MKYEGHNGNLSHKGSKWYTIIDNVWRVTDVPYPGNKRQAQEILIDRLHHLQPIGHPRQMTIHELSQAWLDTVKPTIRDNTYVRYKYNVKKINSYFVKNVKVDSITRADIKTFMSYLLSQGKKNQKTGEAEPMQPASVRYVKLVLSLMMEYAIDVGLITTNPVRGIKIKNTKYSMNDRYLTNEQAQAFLDYIQGDVLYDVIAIALMYGLRREEILGLTINDLNRSSRTLHIHNTITSGTGLQELTKTSTSNRYIPLTDEDVEFFLNLITKKKANREYYGSQYQDSNILLTWEDGRWFRPDYVYARTKRLLRAFGEGDLTFHSFRHTYASIQYDNGVDILTLQKLMGHADSTTTLRIYTSIDRRHLDAKPTGLRTKIIKGENENG